MSEVTWAVGAQCRIVKRLSLSETTASGKNDFAPGKEVTIGVKENSAIAATTYKGVKKQELHDLVRKAAKGGIK